MDNSISTKIQYNGIEYSLLSTIMTKSNDHEINITLQESNELLEKHSFKGDLTNLIDQDANWKFF